MDSVLSGVGDALYTGAGLFWKAAWALAFGYAISSLIQVFVFPREAERYLGRDGARQTGMALGLGFVSSSCSFAALSATRSLFVKGASLRNSLAFLFASTNLVIELAFLLWIFLGWEFVLALYLGIFPLMAVVIIAVRLTPESLVRQGKEHAEDAASGQGLPSEGLPDSWRARLGAREAWNRVGARYAMEWGMVWKELLIGFSFAGAVAALVPPSFFEALFPTGMSELVEAPLHAALGPVLAVVTFIGSMGNGPLAAILWNNGIAFAGIMAFLYSDFVTPPALKINATYYGWRFSLYLGAVFAIAAVVAGITVHALFSAIGLIPGQHKTIEELATFAVDYTLALNLVALAATGALLWLRARESASR